MKNLLLSVGIISIIVCILSLLHAVLNMFGYYRLLDGSAEHYISMRRRMFVFSVIGIIFAVIGTACFIIRRGI